MADIFFDRVQGSRGSLKVDWTSGYYLSQDQRLLLLLAQPNRPPADVDFVHGLVAAVDALVERKLAEWPRIAGPEPPPAPAVALGGPYLTSLGDASLLRKDILVTIATSTVSVFLLFLFAFRRKGALLYAFVPLLAAILITFGLMAVTIGALSSATSVVAALLVGLGIDFVIVSYGRYIEERRRGAGLDRALAAMSGYTGRAVVVGAVTTAATFYAFTFTDFTGLRQMGLMTGTGILICMATVLVLLPAMLAWADDRHVRRQTEPKLYLHSLGTNVLMRFSMRHPRPVLLAGALVTLAAFALSTRLTFDESMKTMRPRGNRGMEVAEEVGRHFGSGFDSMLLLLTGDRLSEVLELSEQAVAGARELIAEGVLQGVSGVPSLIPAPQKQQEALEWLARARSGPLDVRRIRASFARQAAAQGLRVEGFAPGLELLEEAVSLSRPVGVADFQASEQTALLLGRFLRKTDRGWKSAVYLYPPAGKWRREAPPQAVELAERLGDRAVLSGVNVINQRMRQRVLRDAWIAGILGLVVVELLLWINFKNWRLALLGLVTGHGGDLLDARRDGRRRHPDELHQHLRHHHDHRHRRGLRGLRPPPLSRGGRSERGGLAARPGGDRQRRGHGLAGDDPGLRLDHLLELPGTPVHRQDGDPRRLLRLLRDHHPPPRLARLAARGGGAGRGRAGGRAPPRNRRGLAGSPPRHVLDRRRQRLGNLLLQEVPGLGAGDRRLREGALVAGEGAGEHRVAAAPDQGDGAGEGARPGLAAAEGRHGRVVGAVRHQAGEGERRDAVGPATERPAVGARHLAADRAPVPLHPAHLPLREAEPAKGERAHDRHAREAVEGGAARVARPDHDGVRPDDAGDPPRQALAEDRADQAAPVMPHEDRIAQVQPLDQLGERRRVPADGVVGEPRQPRREAEPEEVGRHAAVAGERRDHPPPEEAPGRVAVKQQDRPRRRVLPCRRRIEKVEAAPGVLAALEHVGAPPDRELAGQPLRQRRRRGEGHQRIVATAQRGGHQKRMGRIEVPKPGLM